MNKLKTCYSNLQLANHSIVPIVFGQQALRLVCGPKQVLKVDPRPPFRLLLVQAHPLLESFAPNLFVHLCDENETAFA
jgi:hypothetical protein